MQEVKFCYQNIAVSIDNSGFEVWNKNLFTSTDAFDCVALLHRDGKLYQQQKLANIDVAPEERSSFPLPFMVPALPGEYAVTISFRLKEDTSWAKKGHEVAFGPVSYTHLPRGGSVLFISECFVRRGTPGL